MRLVASVFCLVAFGCAVLAQPAHLSEASYRLEGRSVGIECEDSYSSLIVRLKLDLEVKNTSDKPLIFWNRDSPATMGEAGIVRVAISTNSIFSNQSLIGTNTSEPGNLYGESWVQLRSTLDKPHPPSDATITVEPDQTWKFSSDAAFAIKKERMPQNVGTDKPTGIWIRVTYKSWSPNIEPKADYRASRLVFGKTLRKRWEPNGLLILESLESEPIKLELDKARCLPKKASNEPGL